MNRTEKEENDIRKIMADVSKHFMDQGLLIEAGWQSLAAVVLPGGTSETQRREMRKAYFAGAQHLFSSLISLIGDELVPTEKDLDRLESIHKELNEFYLSLKEEAWS